MRSLISALFSFHNVYLFLWCYSFDWVFFFNASVVSSTLGLANSLLLSLIIPNTNNSPFFSFHLMLEFNLFVSFSKDKTWFISIQLPSKSHQCCQAEQKICTRWHYHWTQLNPWCCVSNFCFVLSTIHPLRVPTLFYLFLLPFPMTTLDELGGLAQFNIPSRLLVTWVVAPVSPIQYFLVLEISSMVSKVWAINATSSCSSQLFQFLTGCLFQWCFWM